MPHTWCYSTGCQEKQWQQSSCSCCKPSGMKKGTYIYPVRVKAHRDFEESTYLSHFLQIEMRPPEAPRLVRASLRLGFWVGCVLKRLSLNCSWKFFPSGESCGDSRSLKEKAQVGAGLWRKLRKGSWQLLLGTVHPWSGEVVLAVLQGFKLLFYWMLQAGAAPPDRSRSSAVLPPGLLARSSAWTRAALAAPPAACKPGGIWVGEGTRECADLTDRAWECCSPGMNRLRACSLFVAHVAVQVQVSP